MVTCQQEDIPDYEKLGNYASDELQADKDEGGENATRKDSSTTEVYPRVKSSIQERIQIITKMWLENRVSMAKSIF